jgi:hypothetical protein
METLLNPQSIITIRIVVAGPARSPFITRVRSPSNPRPVGSIGTLPWELPVHGVPQVTEVSCAGPLDRKRHIQESFERQFDQSVPSSVSFIQLDVNGTTGCKDDRIPQFAILAEEGKALHATGTVRGPPFRPVCTVRPPSPDGPDTGVLAQSDLIQVRSIYQMSDANDG